MCWCCFVLLCEFCVRVCVCFNLRLLFAVPVYVSVYVDVFVCCC